MKPHFTLTAILVIGLLLVGCANDAVRIPVLRDNTYINYAKKFMGKGEGARIKNGPHYEYYPGSRRKKTEFYIKNGKLNGIYTKWDPQGFITTRILYEDDNLIKDLLKEYSAHGLDSYRVQQSQQRNNNSVTKMALNPPSEKVVKNIGREAVETKAVNKVSSPEGSAVKKLGSTSGSAVRRIR
jgi:antitoxin component YwqK of YwqJK toxin-antitoxin module